MKTFDRQKLDAKPMALSLFAGADGCSLGFGQAGCEVRFATDLDAASVDTYRRNLPGTPGETAGNRRLTSEPVLQRT